MSWGVDYSWARPGGAALKAAGAEFAMRYCPYIGDGGKGLTREELADLHANGIAVGLVYESTASRALLGANAGWWDADTAKRAMTELGFPEDRPCYFAVDWDAMPNQYAAIDEYLRGAAEVLGRDRVGVYGSYYVVNHCLLTGTAIWGWQTYAWSGGAQFQAAHLYQYSNGHEINGGAVDYNRSFQDDFGQWLPAAKEEEIDMTADEVRTIIREELATAGLVGQDLPTFKRYYEAMANRLKELNRDFEQAAISAHLLGDWLKFAAKDLSLLNVPDGEPDPDEPKAI